MLHHFDALRRVEDKWCLLSRLCIPTHGKVESFKVSVTRSEAGVAARSGVKTKLEV